LLININGKGEIKLYLAQTGLPEYVSNMYMFVFLREYCLRMVIEKKTLRQYRCTSSSCQIRNIFSWL